MIVAYSAEFDLRDLSESKFERKWKSKLLPQVKVNPFRIYNHKSTSISLYTSINKIKLILHRSPHLVIPSLCNRLILRRQTIPHTRRDTLNDRIRIRRHKVWNGKPTPSHTPSPLKPILKRRQSNPMVRRPKNIYPESASSTKKRTYTCERKQTITPHLQQIPHIHHNCVLDRCCGYI